jgi:hypothetical protein
MLLSAQLFAETKVLTLLDFSSALMLAYFLTLYERVELEVLAGFLVHTNEESE